MIISDIYSKLQTFSVAAINLAGCTVIFANQSTPRPKKPFLIISLSAFRNISKPILKKSDNDGVVTIVTPVVTTASFQSYGDNLHSAETILGNLYSAFNTELQNNIFKGELALHRTLKAVSAVPVALNEQIESRAILELELAFNLERTDDVGLIEHLHLTDTRLNKEYIINK